MAIYSYYFVLGYTVVLVLCAMPGLVSANDGCGVAVSGCVVQLETRGGVLAPTVTTS